MVEALEAFGRRHPDLYRLRVSALALVGLGYRALIGFAFVAVPTVLTFAIYPTKWLVVIGGGLLLVFGLTWFRPLKIEGRRLRNEEAPRLFEELETLRRKIRAPRIDEVILTREFNASAAQHPRLGIFGWQKQILVLGIPLVASLPREQLLAVIGHELGHFSRAHGRMGHWVYRVRHTWENLYQTLGGEDSGIGSAVNQFYRWFVPYFSAYSFALARLNEYEADADSAIASDGASAARALTAVHVVGGYLDEEFWPQVWQLALEEKEPPANVYARLVDAVRTAPLDKLRERQRDALARASDLRDTHPSLNDRLLALRAGDVQLVALGRSAGEDLLGEAWPAVLEQSGADWQSKAAQQWHEHHERLAGHAQRFAELRERPDTGRSIEERIELASLVTRIEGPRAAHPHWHALRAQAADDPRVQYHGGSVLAALRDAAAFDLLDAASRHPGYECACLETAKQLALDLGDKPRADACDTRLRSAVRRAATEAEKIELAISCKELEPHGLPGHAIAVLTRQLRGDDAIASAYLARVRVAGPFTGYLLVVRIDPVPMDSRDLVFTDICGRARGLVEDLLEPSAVVGVLNYFTTETMDEQVAAAFARLEGSLLFG
jgi:Zn-dependent protease with chaperone function